MSAVIYIAELQSSLGFWLEFPGQPLTPVSDLWYVFPRAHPEILEIDRDWLGEPFVPLAEDIFAQMPEVHQLTLKTDTKDHRLGVDIRSSVNADLRIREVVAKHFPDPQYIFRPSLAELSVVGEQF